MKPDERRNDPSELVRYRHAMDRLASEGGWDGTKLNFNIEPAFDSRRADIAALRAGYLSAFALWGYSFACWPSLGPVRRQIAEPSVGHITRFSFAGRAKAVVPCSHAILLATTPFACLLVVMDSAVVLLPSRADDSTLYERFATTRDLQFSGDKWWAWPRRPEYRLDTRGSRRVSPGEFA
jgi:hypothetical protein